MTDTHSRDAARRAQARAAERSAKIKGMEPEVNRVTRLLNRLMEENHFSDKLAVALGKDEHR